MEPFDGVDIERVLAGRSDWIDADLAGQLSQYPLDCLDTEYPHYVGTVDGPEGVDPPSEAHPIFYGCFDWHSAVHSHWCLVRQLRLFDDHPAESDIVQRVDDGFTTENVEGEIAYLADNPSFEKPYGWGWVLRLAAELHLWDDPRAEAWRTTLEPLEARVTELVAEEFLTQSRPFRVGTHGNSAFALACVLDYARVTDARVTGDGSLERAACECALAFFGDDEASPVEYEPLGWDFLSPSLTEADLLRRVLDGAAFVAWAESFFPDVTTAPYDRLLDPVSVESDAEDGIELHLVGLNLSKAWCLAGLSDVLGGHRFADAFERSAQRHAAVGLDHAFTDEYAGAHWLSSFVLYLLTRNEGAIAPEER